MRQICFPLIFCLLLLNSCAFDLVQIDHIPTQFRSDTERNKNFILSETVRFTVGSGYKRELKKGTEWICVGIVEQGSVFRSRDQILTVEASNVYEANIVVSDQQLVGFYLPVEHAFYALNPPRKLVMKETNMP